MALTKAPLAPDMPHEPMQRTSEVRKRRFFTHLIVFAAVNAGLCALNLYKNPQHLWFCWVTFGWGIGIIAHGVKAFAHKD